MATPSQKSEGIEKALNKMFPEYGDRRKSIKQNICTFCKGSAEQFRNEISKKEYTISGLCQKCQDETFGID